MANVSEHVKIDQSIGTEGVRKIGHLHPALSGYAEFKYDGEEGDLVFNGAAIIVSFKSHPDSHFHIDMTPEIKTLVAGIKRGEYDVH